MITFYKILIIISISIPAYITAYFINKKVKSKKTGFILLALSFLTLIVIGVLFDTKISEWNKIFKLMFSFYLATINAFYIIFLDDKYPHLSPWSYFEEEDDQEIKKEGGVE